ncbi:3-deoxy-7-phosphoheptulonate synthase [Streptomyces sp. NPDC048111]|uniref:3-deoxy-7-phosphoheptulonate synthase n=1 Tax=Streptomyces sp. NPDC048111 TaxID=3365500 RepID=UPI00371875E6
MGNILAATERSRARHQPAWDNPAQVELVRAMLSSVTPLVTAAQVEDLRSHLARVATGEAQVLQAGDCAEDPAECTAEHIRSKTRLIDLLAQNLENATGRPVLRVGRIAGQFCKPRSSGVERLGDDELPSFFGHMINGPEPSQECRRPDPLRMLTGYMAAREIMMRLGWVGAPPPLDGPVVWTSHEALLLDYETSMLRELDGGRHLLGSTHWPWIGERTRQIDGPHVALLARVANPVACKVGPSMAVADVVELCGRLDPEREPGRLSLIVRMGADLVADRLPPLVEAVQSAGHPVIWLSDPMHGNTESAADGTKYRLVETVAREVRGFRRVLDLAGAVAGGLHLEATPDEVTECVLDPAELGSGPVTSLCDPRLNTPQAIKVVSAWSEY